MLKLPSWKSLLPESKVNTQEELFKMIYVLQQIAKASVPSVVHALPVLLRHKGKPYTLHDHFMFEPFFATRMPKKIVARTGRQLGKSITICAKGTIQTAAIPFFNILYVTPLHEQILRLSNDAVRPFLEDSPIKPLLSTTSSTGSVLRRAFKNRSVMYFSYAFMSAERIRGIAASSVFVDETQDINADHLPVIEETMSGSMDYGLFQFTGTSKTKDGTLENLWNSSSQAEWCILCKACNHLNIPSMDFDIDKMIGPYSDDISEENPGTICAKCGRKIFPRTGRWTPRFPEKHNDFPGYHIPQIISPVHYSKPEKWKALLGKRQGRGNFTTAKFYNEVLGEAYDISTKLVNQTDLEKVAILHPNTEEAAKQTVNNYRRRILGIDWGGGGESGVSFTAFAVVGARSDGKLDCIFGKRSLTPHDHMAEAQEAMRLYTTFQCDVMAHDYTGAGDLRETILVHNNFPSNRSIRIQYVPAASKNIMVYKPSCVQNPRDHYLLDKTRSLQLTCYAIKTGLLRFFLYDHKDSEEPGLLHDFLALIENKISTRTRSDLYTIQRNPSMSDDFAQAVNLACCAMWQSFGQWPDFTSMENLPTLPNEMLDQYFDNETDNY